MAIQTMRRVPFEPRETARLALMGCGGRGRASVIRQTLDVDFPLDLLMYDPRHLQERLALNEFFLQEITQKGRGLYDALRPAPNLSF